jgi:hypothetical protein
MIYGVLAVSVTWFVTPDPLKDKAVSAGLIIYAGPLVSFFMVFMALWQVEGQLIPLPKFYECDPKLAQQVLAEAVYATDACMQVAFEEVEERLAKKDPAEPMTTPEYFGLLFEAVTIENTKSAKDVPEVEESSIDRFMASLGLEPVEEYGHGVEVSRPDVFTWGFLLGKRDWWVHRLLFSKHFADDRAVSFRHWARAHNIVAAICMLLTLEVYISTIVDFFREQKPH